MALQTATWQMVNQENSGLTCNHVTAVAVDPDGNLWFATYGSGLCRCSPEGDAWQNYRASEGGLTSDYVGAVATGPDGRVWVACDTDPAEGNDTPANICVLSPDGTWRTALSLERKHCVLTLEADHSGAMWAAIGWRVKRMRWGSDLIQASSWITFEGTSQTTYETQRDAVIAWYPHRTLRTHLGWAVDRETAWLLETVRHELTPALGLDPMSAMMMQGMLGSFMTDYNLVSYAGERSWEIGSTLPAGSRFSEIAVDGEGHTWVSLLSLGDLVMGGGIARLEEGSDGGKWTVYNKASGLCSDNVMAMTVDSRGHLWLSHLSGDFSRWDGKGWTKLEGGQAGRGTETFGRGVEDQQGRLWFPSASGALVYRPEKGKI